MRRITDINVAKEYVRDKSDLTELIREDIGDRVWKEEGSSTSVTTSPFREETKPSFKVRGNRFKDWGGEQHGGDIFYWIQLWHGLKFEESIIYAADRFKIDITQFLRDLTPEEKELIRYKQINRIAAEWMHQCLRENGLVRDDYLSRSSFTLDMVEPYLVGYCATPDALVNYISSQTRITENDIKKLELYRRDLFTNAIIYPVHNHSGEIVYFYTRQLVDDSHYMGMKSEHPLHDLSIIYGFHVAKKSFRKNGYTLALVEGQRDAIALKAGGVLGSELKEQQLNAIKDHKIKNLIFCYDNDNTGWTKSLDLINKPRDFGDILVSVTAPQELDADPHDMWKQGGDGAVYQMFSNAVIPLEYYITRGGFSLESMTDKHRLLSSLRDYLVKTTGIHLSIAIAYLAKLLDSPKESIYDYITEIKASFSQLYNLEAERTLIAKCMGLSASFSTAKSAGIEDRSFTYSKYRRIFQSCQIAYNKYGEKYTPQVVLDEIMANFLDQDMPGVVAKVLEDTYKYTEPVACEIVLDMFKRRVTSEQAENLIASSRDLSQSFVEVVNGHRKELISVVSGSRPQARTPKELGDEFLAELKYREQLGGNPIIGYDFHSMPSINLILGGIQPGHMIVLAGDTGAGKSLLAMNILHCLSVKGDTRALWIGQEMSSKENTMRLVSIDSGFNNTRLQQARLSQREAEMVVKTKEKIDNSGYYMAKPRNGDIEEILSIIDEYRWKYDIKYVVWDYIGLVRASKDQRGANREEIIGNASNIMKNRVAEDMGLATIVLAQMNRDKFSSGKQKIAGSYRIIQDADDFLWIEEKTQKQIADDGIAKGNRYVRIGKRRGGISDYTANAHLDTDPGSCSLRIRECITAAEISKLHHVIAA